MLNESYKIVYFCRLCHLTPLGCNYVSLSDNDKVHHKRYNLHNLFYDRQFRVGCYCLAIVSLAKQPHCLLYPSGLSLFLLCQTIYLKRPNIFHLQILYPHSSVLIRYKSINLYFIVHSTRELLFSNSKKTVHDEYSYHRTGCRAIIVSYLIKKSGLFYITLNDLPLSLLFLYQNAIVQ